MKCIYFFLFCLIISHYAAAQQGRHTDREYAKSPFWIDMIKDTTANYFEVEHAYKVYFEHHEKPEGENEDIGEHEKREKQPTKRERRKMQQENHMRMDVKKYERWHDLMHPYVQEDGSILTPSQRLQLWKDQQRKK